MARFLGILLHGTFPICSSVTCILIFMCLQDGCETRCAIYGFCKIQPNHFLFTHFLLFADIDRYYICMLVYGIMYGIHYRIIIVRSFTYCILRVNNYAFFVQLFRHKFNILYNTENLIYPLLGDIQIFSMTLQKCLKSPWQSRGPISTQESMNSAYLLVNLAVTYI